MRCIIVPPVAEALAQFMFVLPARVQRGLEEAGGAESGAEEATQEDGGDQSE